MELFEDTRPGANAPEFTVSEISGAVKRVIEGEFGRVRVRGEVGRVSRPSSGHLYLDLKDDRSVLGAVIWKGTARGLATKPEEGMEVVATGRLTTFPGSSKYQMVIEEIAPAGAGALMAMLEKRRQALAAEGLFDAGRKRALPYLPEVIGVVTSPSGAVIRDILHRLRERFPRPVLLWPVTVQGPNCAAEVTAAIRGFNALAPGGRIPRPDVLIVARGGGSIEDLWGFNEEIVVRAVAESRIPVISAVGHETDTTLIDHAADRRAPTPTAAAEMAVPVRLDLLAALGGLDERRRASAARGLALRGQRLRDLARGLPRPEAILGERAQRLDALGPRLPRALVGLVRARELGLARGPAGRFGPVLLRHGLERRGERLRRVEAGLSPRRMAELVTRLGDRLDAWSARLERDGARLGRDEAARLAALTRTLETLDPEKVLGRGYAIVRDARGHVVSSAEPAGREARLEIQFADGRVAARPETAPPRPRRRAGGGADEDQGQLL
ncbi:MAG: exodeoxyribonuclease VII large subunit [Rhodovulum sulfidophilum]|uniref:Exodeoxyribonuclease 7 large subunit n=1 Tax=Rhodovulum sulfidophilum TaxID=35806 RepID=A0A2W5Q3Z0_RHOSU|nr:MAG: exodeoxyribonuclease VII large subunit [Rhodovulum sulfidophilum]